MHSKIHCLIQYSLPTHTMHWKIEQSVPSWMAHSDIPVTYTTRYYFGKDNMWCDTKFLKKWKSWALISSWNEQNGLSELQKSDHKKVLIKYLSLNIYVTMDTWLLALNQVCKIMKDHDRCDNLKSQQESIILWFEQRFSFFDYHFNFSTIILSVAVTLAFKKGIN